MKNNKGSEKMKKMIKEKWLVMGFCISLLAAIIFTGFYGSFKRQAEIAQENPLEQKGYLSLVYRSVYVLYRDLYNQQNGMNASYSELYYAPVTESGVWDKEVEVILDYLVSFFVESESAFTQVNSDLDYIIEDTVTGKVITNLPYHINMNPDSQYFYVQFWFDEYGNATLDAKIRGEDTAVIRKNAKDIMHEMDLRNAVQARYGDIGYEDYLKLSAPKNCKVTFCVKPDDYKMIFFQQASYWQTKADEIYFYILVIVFLLGIVLPSSLKGKPWNEHKLCRPIMEWLIFVGVCALTLKSNIFDLVEWTASGKGVESFRVLLSGTIAVMVVYLINIVILCGIFSLSWYVGVCVSEIRELGIKEYLQKRSLFYKICLYMKRKLVELYQTACHIDITGDVRKFLLKIVLINGVIVCLISCLWIIGFPIALIYSLILYFLLRKYISELQKKYGTLLGALNRIAEGKLDEEITEDLGVFEPFKPQVIQIQNGFQKAVDEEVKSQRMRAELLTNVSHDLKTPLTAIITYINLLKEETITEAQRKEYLETLERKSMRLKVLIEDVVEVSKANSKNMTVNLMDVDLCNLLKQVSFELSGKMVASKLDVRMNLPEEKVILSLDSQKTYRVYENLLGNIAKYALTGTRVYVDLVQNQEEVSVILRNISAHEIMVNAEELTERFVRGDISRNTEGSGLGLAIAKSLTELQGGKLEVSVDGDLFKVITIWRINKK